MGMRGLASLQSFSENHYLSISLTWRCELGRLLTLHSGALHIDPPVAFASALANDCLCVFAMCKAHVQEMLHFRLLMHALTFARCGAWPLTIALSSEYLNERTNESSYSRSKFERTNESS